MLNSRERRRFSPEEYLLLEEQAEHRSEYWGGEIFSMTGGSLEHNEIVGNLVAELKRALRGTPCRVYASDVRLWVDKHALFTYPDLLVVCGPPSLMKGRRDTLTEAQVILEVLSPSTESYDRGEKFRMYSALESLQEYVLVAQEQIEVERHQRQEDGGWLWTRNSDPQSALVLSSLSLEIPLRAIYEGVLT